MTNRLLIVMLKTDTREREKIENTTNRQIENREIGINSQTDR